MQNDIQYTPIINKKYQNKRFPECTYPIKDPRASVLSYDRLPLIHTCFTLFHMQYRCQGCLSRTRCQHVRPVKSIRSIFFGFAIGQLCTSRGAKLVVKIARKCLPMYISAGKANVRVAQRNVFIFGYACSFKIWYESSSCVL